jgi:hypothetical protein
MTTTRKLTPFQIADRQRWAAFTLTKRADILARTGHAERAARFDRAALRCTALARLTFRTA